MIIKSCTACFFAGFLTVFACLYVNLIIEKKHLSEDDAILYAYDRLQHIALKRNIPLEDFIGPEVNKLYRKNQNSLWEVAYKTDTTPIIVYRMTVSEKGAVKLWSYGKTPEKVNVIFLKH